MAKTQKKTNRWSHKVKTVSTFPQKDLFTKKQDKARKRKETGKRKQASP